MIKSALCAAIAALAMLCGSRAQAWGNDGHRIVGHIAASLLSDSARQTLLTILGSDDLPAVATELDESRDAWERRHPGASKWHYENRAVCGNQIACPQGQCVTRQIDNHLRVLRNPLESREARIEALTVVVHLIADLHQPLHLTDNRDRGGNDVWALMPREREPRRLHEVWDTRLVRLDMQRRSAPNYSQSLLQRYADRQSAWAKGSTESWAAETYRIGRDSAYFSLPGFSCSLPGKHSNDAVVLSPEYVESARKIAAEQLAKAGVRLAAVLNATLGSSTH
jgi:hypothetical protein